MTGPEVWAEAAVRQARVALEGMEFQSPAELRPVNAELATTYAVLALVEQVHVLTEEVRALRLGGERR